MRFIPVIIATLFALAASSPTPTTDQSPASANIHKRASISDAATIGYASQNGG